MFATLVFINFLYAPFIAAFKDLRNSYESEVLSFELTIECFWGAQIIVSLVQGSVDKKIFTFTESAKRYMRGFAIVDIPAFTANVVFIVRPDLAELA